MTLLCKLTCQCHMKTLSIQNTQLCLCQCFHLKQKSFCLLQLKSLFDTQTDTIIFPSISNFQGETPCPPSDENEIPPEFDESLIDMSEHDIQQLIDGQNKNTMKKTLGDVALVEKCFRLKKEERDIHLITPNELDPLLANFLLTEEKRWR